jgi:ABC-type transport system involved in cytochrome c biogenesis permease subunit
MISRMHHWIAAVCVLILGAVAGCSKPVVPKVTTKAPNRVVPWTDGALAAAAEIPIQDGGRIKPLDTYARFALLQFSAKRSLKVEIDGREEELSALAWFLDVLFFPRQAAQYPVFLVEDYDVLSDIGLDVAGLKKRDRYSYEFLVAAQEKLFANAGSYSDKPADERSLVEKQVLRLANLFVQYEHMQYALHSARRDVDVATMYSSFQADFPGATQVPLAEFVPRLPEYARRYDSLMLTSGEEPTAELRELASVLRDLDNFVMVEKGTDGELRLPMRIFPAPVGAEEWFTPGMLIQHSFASIDGIGDQIELFRKLTSFMPSQYRSIDMATLEKGLVDFSKTSGSLMHARGEGERFALEISFYRANYFFLAQWLFVAAFMLACLMWVAPNVKLLYGATWSFAILSEVLLIAGITIRCIVRQRPPVSTLYESILFIAAVCVIAAFVIELINRQRIALFIATLSGAAGLFLAAWYEGISGVDTMPQLEAVLDTNFWLSTHVTTITIGYSAGYLAAGFAAVYLVGMLIGLVRGGSDRANALSRMVYGSIAFCVVFSTVGTILGGVWANDSWGRFWGWDPKENGALMIVLTTLVLLHARLGGYIRQFGLCLGAIFLAAVVTFSWFHTNQLGIGLHSYGFDAKIYGMVIDAYKGLGTIFVLGCVAWWFDRRRAAVSSSASDTANSAASRATS